jgi:integrase
MCWFNGRKVKLAKGRQNRSEAQKRLDELRYEASKNPPPEANGQTVASVIDTYLGFARKRLAPSTLGVRIPYLQSFAELHGWRPVSECKPFHMEAWLDDHPEWASDWTKNSALRNVQVAFNWAVTNKVISSNPFRGVTHSVGNPRRDMTPKEFIAILRATRSDVRWKARPTPGARFRHVLYFLWLTGCRPSEAANLRWENVDFENDVISIPQHKTSRTQRRPRPRVVPMHPAVKRLLTSIQNRHEGEVVFLNHRGTPWNKNTLAQRVKRARQIAGVPDDAKLYGVRHAFGTRGIVNGVDIKTLSELLGHTSTRMAEHYVHLADQRGHLAAAMRRVNARRRET